MLTFSKHFLFSPNISFLINFFFFWVKENREPFEYCEIFLFLTWNVQNHIIIGHPNVELAMILHILVYPSIHLGPIYTSVQELRKGCVDHGDPELNS